MMMMLGRACTRAQTSSMARVRISAIADPHADEAIDGVQYALCALDPQYCRH